MISYNCIRPSAAIISPTTGSEYLTAAIESVRKQDYNNLTHYIVIDGAEYEEDTLKQIRQNRSTKIITLPKNTGKLGFNGHRIYAAFSYILDEDYFFLLDEDNWYDKHHVSSMLDIILNSELDWGYSLRKIFSHDGRFISNDDCESLGSWKPYSGFANLVDTNCYAIKKSIMTKFGNAWYHPKGADRHFYNILSSANTKYQTSGLYTVNYRLHKNRLPNEDYFINGNKTMQLTYKNRLPWKKY